MRWTQHFFIEGRHLGTATRTQHRLAPDAYRDPISLLWYCARCGDCYAKAPVLPDPAPQCPGGQGSTLQPIPFFGLRACCRKCKPLWSGLVPGSIWTWPDYPDPGLLEALPGAVLQWEYQRHCEWYDNERL